MMTWPLRAIAFGVLMCVSAWLLERALRATRVPLRAIWCMTLLISVCVPLCALYQPQLWPDALRPVTIVQQVVVNASAQRMETPARDAFPFAATAMLWCALVVVCSARYAWGWLTLWRARRHWGHAHCCGEAVLVSKDVGPALVGVVRARVVVPAWLLRSDATRQHMALLHEREHARARDHWLLALAPLLAIVFPWNLALWWQLRRLRLAIELDCDRRVLAHGVQRRAYGTMLLEIAAGTHMARVAALAEPRSLLSHRIAALVTHRPASAARMVLVGCTCAVLLVGVVVTAPALVHVAPLITQAAPAPAVLTAPAIVTRAQTDVRHAAQDRDDSVSEPDAPAAAIVATPLPAPLPMRAERLAPPVRIRETTVAAPKPLFIVDGVIVSESRADQSFVSSPADIENIEVIKGAAAEQLYGPRAAHGVISITTKKRTGR
jgi:bla regulator protein BlaR1